jgi:hypothetical protein
LPSSSGTLLRVIIEVCKGVRTLLRVLLFLRGHVAE